jgi:hypothetical protein
MIGQLHDPAALSLPSIGKEVGFVQKLKRRAKSLAGKRHQLLACKTYT